MPATYKLDAINAIIGAQTGTAGAFLTIPAALNALLGGGAAYYYEVDAINALVTAAGGEGGYQYCIDGLNALLEIKTGTNPGFQYSVDAYNALIDSFSPTPEQAHITAMRAAAPNASGLYMASQYTASLVQAGQFVDAFGGALTYDAPSIMASPARVVDETSGMAYVSADGADDTAIGSAAETVACYTAVFRSPPGQDVWNTYGAPLDHADAADAVTRLGLMAANTTEYYTGGGTGPRAVRRNGIALPSLDLAPITAWQVVTVYTRGYTATQLLQLLAAESLYYLSLHLAEIIPWPTDPSDDEVQAAEAELARYYAPLIATNP